MTMIERLKTPMAVGLFVAGLLLFAVIGIARNVSGAAVASAVSNNVAGAVGAVVSLQPASIPALGAIQSDQAGDKWFWLGNVWIACRHIDPVTLAYNSIRNDPANTAWSVLATGEKQKVVEVCHE